MLLSLFLSLSSCSIYALDVGSENLRLAVSNPGKPIDIVSNERGQRFTPNYLAYPIHNASEDLAKEQWIVGSEAERIFYRNSTHAVENPFALLWTPNNTDFAGLSPIVSVATLLYYNLRHLETRLDKVTLTVPLYTSPHVRYSLHQSMKLLGFRSVNILDSCTAVASLYAVERLRKGQKKSGTTILFIDIGSENMDCSLFKFKSGNKQNTHVELLQYRHSNRVGGRFVDQQLIQYVSKEIGKEFVGSEVFTVRNIVRKAKERLALNKDIGVDLTEDYGKYITLTQETMQELTQNMTSIIRELLTGIDKPDEIELIGGSSRLKVFLDVIQEVLPDVPMRRSLNSDEAIAVGAANYQSLKSGSNIGKTIDLKKPTVLGLNVTIENQNQVVFEPGDIVTSTVIKMPADSSRIISTYLDTEIYDEYIIDSKEFNTISNNYTQILIENVDNALNSLADDLVNGTTPEIALNFGTSPDLDCPDLISASLLANITTSNRRLWKKGHGNTTITERKLFAIPSLLDKEFHVPKNARAFIKKLVKEDEDRRNRQEACHKIESFIIDSREKSLYDDDFRTVTTEDERKEMIEHLEEERKKIDCTVMIKESADDLEKRLKDLKNRYEKPFQRLEEYVYRPLQLKKLLDVLQRADAAIPERKCDDETFNKFLEYVNETRQLIANVTTQSPLDQPNFTIKDMKDREKELLKKIPELKRPPKKSNVINFSTSDADDMDDDEYDRLRQAGIMFNRPRKRKHFDIPENQDLKEDIDKERKYFKKFKDIQTNESRDFRDEKRSFQSANRNYYRFDSYMRRNETYTSLIANLTKDLNHTVDELRENLTRMRQEGIERRLKLQEARWYNATLKNATSDDGTYNETLHKELIEKLREEDKQMKIDREEARRIRKEEEKKKREEEEEERKRKEEEERKKKEQEEEERKAREARRANMTEEEKMYDIIGEPPQELNEEEKKNWLEKKVNEYKAKQFMLDNADSIDDDLKELTSEERRKYEDLKRKFEGTGGSKPFESEEDRRKYEDERRTYDQLKRRARETPTPKPTKTPKPSETPLPPEWEELDDDLKALTDDENRYYNDRVKLQREKIEFAELIKVYPIWQAAEDEKKAKEQAERERRQREREEARKKRQEEDAKRRAKMEEDRKRRLEAEEQRKKQREEERERRRREMEARQKQQELHRKEQQERAAQRAAQKSQQRPARSMPTRHPTATPTATPAQENQQQQPNTGENQQQQPNTGENQQQPTPSPQTEENKQEPTPIPQENQQDDEVIIEEPKPKKLPKLHLETDEQSESSEQLDL